MGLIFGAGCCLALKTFRFLTTSPIIETFMIFAFSLCSYFLTELITINGLEMSGIIALLTCGIFNAHYTYYNISA